MLYITNFISNFAQAYGAGSYGAGTYQGAGTGSSSSSGVLTNTGFDLLLAATIAVTIIFLAMVIRFWKRPRQTSKELQEG